jgi:hypothetical protein
MCPLCYDDIQGLQELYITPKLLSSENYDDLAESVNWFRDNADVLADVHWIGGNPEKLEIYGWAAWTPVKATLTLRNPDIVSHEIGLDVSQVFELPERAPDRYILRSPYEDQRIQNLNLEKGKIYSLKLEPFEVLVFDGLPVTSF